MKIYTRTGDKGSTGLFGGQRVSKSSPRLHAYGTLDELNACLGSVVADAALPDPLREHLLDLQSLLFRIGADLATPLESGAKIKRMDESFAVTMEQWIDALDEGLPPLTAFILPGGSPAGAKLHEARTLCRRAERWIVELHDKEAMTPAIIVLMNRLSDYLFVAARYANHALGEREIDVKIPRE